MSELEKIKEMAKDLKSLDDVSYYPNCNYIYRRAEKLKSLGYIKQKWISVEERLPNENEVVLIWVGGVRVARFLKGITEEERQKMESGELQNPKNEYWCSSAGYTWIERSKIYTSSDVHGNNLVPYSWEEPSDNMKWFGQNVNYWLPLPQPPETKGETE